MRRYFLAVYALGLFFLAVALPAYATQASPSQNNRLAESAQTDAPTITNTSDPSTQDPNAQDLSNQDPNAQTLAKLYSPTDSELSYANTELLAKNAKLTREVNDLTTQVNVLVQEHSGQLFIYGAMTAVFSMIIGFMVAKLTSRQRW